MLVTMRTAPLCGRPARGMISNATDSTITSARDQRGLSSYLFDCFIEC